MNQPGFWSQENTQDVIRKLKSLKALLNPLRAAVKADDDLSVMVEMGEEDESMAAEVLPAIEQLEQTLEELEVKALLSGPLDPNSALITINARDGGTDANDWAEMLLRMYLAWAKSNEYD